MAGDAAHRLDDQLGFPPQFVAHGPSGASAQIVADDYAFNGIGHNSAERASAHAHCHDAVT